MTHSLLLIETSMSGTYDLRPKVEQISIAEAKDKDWYQTFVHNKTYQNYLPRGDEDIYELCLVDIYINGKKQLPLITMLSLFNRSHQHVRRVHTLVENNVGNLKFLIADRKCKELIITETNISMYDLDECFCISDGTNFVYNGLIEFNLDDSKKEMIACALKISTIQQQIVGLQPAHQHVTHAAAASSSRADVESSAATAATQSFRPTPEHTQRVDQTSSSRAAAAAADAVEDAAASRKVSAPQPPVQKRADNPAAHHARAAAASSSQDATVFRFASLSGAAAAAASSRAASSHPLRAAETSSSPASTVFRPTSFSGAAAAAASSEAAASAAAHPTHPTHLFVQSRPAEGLIFE
jgi:hypothetical protein